MRRFYRLCVILAFLLVSLPLAAQAQVSLLTPEDGVELTSPPTFEWESEYNLVFFVSLFTYGEQEIGHPFFFAVPFRDSITMPQRWWDKLSYDVPQTWLVVGFEGPRQPVFSETWTFKKVAE